MKNNLEVSFWFVGLVLLQVLLLNNLQIGKLINPFLYIYFIIALPIHWNKSLLILLGFILGIVIDAFSNTWGIHTMATTFIAYLRPYILKLVAAEEDLEKFEPRLNIMRTNYIKYIVIVVLLHHLTLFSLEAFSFNFYWIVLLKAIVSSIITLTLIFAIEKIRH